MRTIIGLTSACAVAAALSACSGSQAAPPEDYGADPSLPAPVKSLIPTVKIAKAVGWPEGAKPIAAPGLQVGFFAAGLRHPRWLYVLPNTDVLVAESDGPAKAPHGVRDWITGKVMQAAGSGQGSADRITLLRDNDGDGVAESRSTFIEGVPSPFGMTLAGGKLYVASADAIYAYDYKNGQKTAGPGVKITDLPGGPINHHWTKTIIASRDGARLYAAVGSNSNVGENGLPAEAGRAAIWQIDLKTGAKRLYATGLRNPNGMAITPDGVLWTVVNERDDLGDNLVPDYLTSVQDGGFYGWPYSYWGAHVDVRVKPQRPDLVAKAIVPDYALGSHVAALGLAFYRNASRFPEHYKDGAFIGEHGSWNRSEPAGYKVVFVPFARGRPTGPPEDILTGFLDAKGRAQGRPVGVAVARDGALLVADDVGDMVWRVTPTAPPEP